MCQVHFVIFFAVHLVCFRTRILTNMMLPLHILHWKPYPHDLTFNKYNLSETIPKSLIAAPPQGDGDECRGSRGITTGVLECGRS